MKTHLRFLWCCLALLCVTITSRAQLTGTITVPSTTYPTLKAVVDSLNNQGVGTGGVIVNVGANETAPVGGYVLGSATLNASTSASKKVVINGGGRTLTAYVGTGTADGIFFIAGTDWVEINGLNLAESSANTSNTTRMEWGYSLVKLSSTAPYDGCQNVLINGCTITLDKTYSSTIGIRAAHTLAGSTSTLGTGSVTVASTNSYNNFTANTISGVTRGISLVGISSTAANMDRDNKIGGTSSALGNTITYGGSSNTSYGVFTQNDSVITVRNNKFFIGAGQTTTSYGYQASTGRGDLTVTNNVFDVNVTATSASVYGYYNSGSHSDPSSGISAVTTHTITGNVVTGSNTTATSASFYGLYSSNAYCYTLNMNNNTIRDINLPVATSGSFYGIYTSYSYAPRMNVLDNTIYNISKPNNTTSAVYGYYVYEYSHSTGDLRIERNTFRKVNWRYYLQPFYIYSPYYTTPPTGYPQSKTYFRYNVCDSMDFSSSTAQTSTYLYNWIYYGMDTVDKSYNVCKNIIGPGGNNSFNAYPWYLYSYSQGAMNTLNHRHVGNVVDSFTHISTSTNNYIYNALGYYAETCDSNRVSNFSMQNGYVYNYMAMYSGNTRAVGNVIKNMNFTGTSGQLYTYMGYSIAGTFDGHHNVIDSVATNAASIYGFVTYANGNPWKFHNNRISRIWVSGTAPIYGYYTSSSAATSPADLYNNFFTDLQLPTGYSNSSASAFYLISGADYKLYHNTIRISTTNNAGFTGILYPTSGTLDLRNNIINVNVNPTSTTAFTVALRRQSGVTGTAPANFLPSSNGNIFYAPNVANSWLYGEGGSAASMQNAYNLTNDPQFNTPCGLFKNFMSHNFGSFTENNLIAATTPNTYRPNGTIASFAQNGGVPTAFVVPTDYDGVTRGPLPDMGALEFSGTALDQAPPVISYTPVPKQSYCVTTPQIIATITDVTGVDTTRTVGTTNGRAPRLYFKKANDNTTDADVFSNVVANNSNTFNGWKWVEPTTISGNQYTFNFNYGLLRSPVVPGDTIKYFIIAQDLAATPNTGYNIANFTACPSTVVLGSTNSPLLGTPEANGFRILVTPNFDAVSYPPAACQSGSTVVSVDPVPYGASVQWQSATLTGAFSNIAGATNFSYTTPTLTTTTRYRAVLSCGSSTLATSAIDTFIIAKPTIVATGGSTTCGYGPATLTATGGPFTVPKWYASATGGTMLATGNTFVTPSISSTTTYYVSGTTSNASTETVVGYPKSGVYSGYDQLATMRMRFNNAATNFYSTTVYPYYATVGTTVTFDLDDSATLARNGGNPGLSGYPTRTLTIPFTGTGNLPVVVNLNWLNIPPGPHVVTISPQRGASLHWNYDPKYPYTSPSGGTQITGGELAGQALYYPYMYNNVVGADCESATRTPVVATVTPAPPITTSSPQVPGVCIGGSATLNVGSANPYYVYTWTTSPATAGFPLVAQTFTVTPSTTTTYFVDATDPYTGCKALDSIKIHVNAQPAPPILTPSPANICAGKSVRLTASAPPGVAGVGSLGTGTATNSTVSPAYGFYTRNQTHYLVTAAELNSMGIVGPNLLTSWAFNVSSTGSTIGNFTIKIIPAGTTSSLSTVTCAYGTPQTVYFQSSYTPTIGWNTFNFNTNFSWDGVQNIVIVTTHDNDPVNCGSNWGNATSYYYHNTTFNSSIQTYSDGPGCSVTTCSPSGGYGNYPYAFRPNMRIGYTAPSSVNWLNVTNLYKNAGLTQAVSLTDTTKSPYAAPTVTTVYTAITNLFGCKSLPSLPDTVYVTPSPDVTITPAGPQTICAGQTVTLCIPTAVNQTYQWYLNNNPISGGTSNCYTATAAGNYKVTATNIVTGCANTSIDVPVTVNPAPAVTVTRYGAKVVCKGVTDTLVASGTNLVSYQWKQNGVNIAGATSPTLIVTTSGIYTVEVTNNNNCVGTSAPDTITVNVTPTTITPMGPTTFCNGMTVTLQGPTPPTGVTYTYQWRENGVAIPGATGSTHTTGLTGSYTVVVTNTTTGCTDSSVATVVNVGPPPSSAITPNGNLSLCQGGSVTLNAIAQPGLSYQWYNGTTAIAGATTPTYTATTAGTYTVQVSISGTASCSSQGDNSAVLNLNPLPTATATAAGGTRFCQGNSVVISAATNAANATYQWNLNGNPISGQTAANITVATGGNYSVTINNTSTGCTNVSNTVAITVDTLPVTSVASTTPTTFCQGGSVNLCVPTGATSYAWNLNGTPITGATTACYSATATGLYSVTVRGTNGCSATSAQTSVQVNALPDATTIPTGNAAVCQGYTINLTANNDTNYTYQWMLNNVNISGATNATYPTGAGGTYKVKITNKITGCTATSADIIVSVNTPPTATAALIGAGTICQGDSTRINANTGTGFMYQWRRNGVNIPGENNAYIYAKQAGSYTVNVSNATNCFNISNAVVITVNPRPAAYITYNTPLEFCEGSAVVLNANPGTGLTYQWLVNGAPVGNTGTYFEAKTSGKYALLVTNNFSCTSSSDTLNILVHPAPVPSIVRNGTTLETTTPYVSYQWFFNSDPVGGATNQSFNYTENGAYKVRVIDIYGCEGMSNLFFVNNVGVHTAGAGKSIRVYPNPTTGLVNIEASVKVKLVLRDITGKSVLEASDVKQINLGDIANGMYLLYISDMNGNLLRAEKVTKTAH